MRTQIQLTESQAEALRRMAAAQAVSMAALVREAVDRLIAGLDPGAERTRALSVVGRYDSGKADVSAEHDRYLDEAYGA